MKWTDKESYSLPVVLAVTLHVVVFGAGVFAVTLSDVEPQPPKRPPIVNAKIVDVSDTVIGKREAEQKQAAAKAQQDAKRKAQEQARRKAEKAELEKQRKKAAAEKRKQEQARKKAEDERRAAQAKKKAEEEKARRTRIEKEKKAAEEKAQREREKAAEEKAKREAERKRQQELERQRAAEAERQRKEAEKIKQDAERRKRAEEAIKQAMAEEDRLKKERVDSQAVQSLVGVINSRIAAAWIRPPNARNGMKVTMAINFLPNGEVAAARVTKSSGDPVFDKRAVDAVHRVGRIEELSDLDSYTFQQQFREVVLVFNPQDLRN